MPRITIDSTMEEKFARYEEWLDYYFSNQSICSAAKARFPELPKYKADFIKLKKRQELAVARNQVVEDLARLAPLECDTVGSAKQWADKLLKVIDPGDALAEKMKRLMKEEAADEVDHEATFDGNPIGVDVVTDFKFRGR